jgi:hypothetical protein
MIEIEIDGQELEVWKKAIAYSEESLAYFTPKAGVRDNKVFLQLTPEDIDDLLTLMAMLPKAGDEEEEAYADFEDLLLFSLNSSKEDIHEL